MNDFSTKSVITHTSPVGKEVRKLGVMLLAVSCPVVFSVLHRVCISTGKKAL